MQSVKKLEEKMELSEDTSITCRGVHLGCGHRSNKKTGGDEKYELFRPPPTSCGEFAKNMSWAFNVAYTNLFCITRPIGNDTPSVRHFMVGLYPLHFVVNMTALVFEKYFSSIEVFAIQGYIFNYNNVVLVAIFSGVANLFFFTLFYYAPNIFTKKTTYKVAASSTKAEKEVKNKRKQFLYDLDEYILLG